MEIRERKKGIKSVKHNTRIIKLTRSHTAVTSIERATDDKAGVCVELSMMRWCRYRAIHDALVSLYSRVCTVKTERRKGVHAWHVPRVRTVCVCMCGWSVCVCVCACVCVVSVFVCMTGV